MKDLTKIIQKGNLTPRERALLIVKHDAHLVENGEALLSEADLVALTTNWRPLTNNEAEQYNRIINLWELYQKLQIDMQTIYLTTQLALSRLEHAASMVYYRSDSLKQTRHKLSSRLLAENDTEFRAFFLEHSGYEYDRLIHLYTFYSLPKAVQKDILKLDDGVKYDHTYLSQEEQIVRIMGTKKTLDTEGVEAITKAIIDSIPWGHELRLPNTKISVKEVIFNGYFAGYPLIEFGKRMASRHNITYESEDELRDKLSEVDDLQYKLEKVVRDVVSDGSFFDEFTPLCMSKGYRTHEGKTVLPHDELMNQWMKAKDSITETIDGHIDSGELEVCECPVRFFEIGVNKTYITGNSLDQTSLKLPLTKDFQTQLDESMDYVLPAFLVHKSTFFDNYQYLLGFKELTAQISEIIGVDLSETVERHLEAIQESVDTLGFYIRQLNDQLLERNNSLGIQYRLQTFIPDPSFRLISLPPKQNESLEIFAEKLKALLP